MDEEEGLAENPIPSVEVSDFVIGTVVRILDNINVTATGTTIPETWHNLLFVIKNVYDDSILMINEENGIYARMYTKDLDIMEVNE